MEVRHFGARATSARSAQRFIGWPGKRVLDLLAMALAAPALLPLITLVAVIVRIGIGSPVLFRQTRVGYQGRKFEIVKFRTMRDDRDAQGKPLPDDARLTRLGVWLRATSLDELPEFWNVLSGDMSLVGPRPLLVDYLELYSPKQMRRHEVRPGLTGLAQIKGRNALTWQRKFHYDVIYVDRCSLALDLWILARSVVITVKRQGISEAGHATASPFLGNGPPVRAGQRSTGR